MKMALKLSNGIIAEIHNGAQPSDIILQVMAVRKFPTGDRCRLLVSDGVYTSGFAILASQLNHLVTSGEVAQHSVVHITRYLCNEVSDSKKMLIILEMKVLLTAEDAGDTIGNPVPFDANAAKSAAAAAPARPAPTAVVAAASPAMKVHRNPPNTNTTSTGAVSGSGQAPAGMPNVRLINTLTPYQNKWTICARVTSKGNIRTWSNSRGDGKLFSMDLLDESGEIRATAFNAECDRFYELIEPNNVYFISGANLKTANKQYSSLKNDYEMSLNNSTQITQCHEDTGIPAMQFDFVTLDQLEASQKDAIIDLVAVCREAQEMSSVIQRSTGKELKKRDIQLVDHTNRTVNLTLWGETAEKFDGSGCPVLAIKGAKVSDFGGVSLSCLVSSTMQVNPDISEAHQLKGWWEQTGSTSSDLVNLSGQRGGAGGGPNAAFKTLMEVQSEGLGSRDQADYYSLKGVVSLVRKENVMYMSCSNEGCNKKVLDMGNGLYRCEKCNKETDSFNWRFMLNVNVADFTDNTWCTLFHDTAESFLGISAHELGAMRDDDPDQFQRVLLSVTFNEFIFKMRVKMETFNDESRLKTTVVTLNKMNPVEYNKRLIKEINEMTGQA